jgi:hypothetical protein
LRSPARVNVSSPEAMAAIFYTKNGADPRTVFGDVTSDARAAAGHIAINQPTVVRARVRIGEEWSPLVTAAYTVDQDFSKLLISEIMYHPRNSSEDAEFIEFANVGPDVLDLDGLFFRDGSDEGFSRELFHFSTGSRITPGAFLVLVRQPEVHLALHPERPIHGIMTTRLSNSYGNLRLESNERALATEAFYDSAAPWQVVPDNHGYFPDDGVGFSLVRSDLDPDRDPSRFSQWRASARRFGSPGRDDPPSTVPVVFINELMTRGNGAFPDFVEFFNPNDHAVDLGGWWLSDERNSPFQYNLPAGTVVPARGYLALEESQFGARVGFSGEGERCYLFSADTTGVLTGYSHGLAFAGADRLVSFGRHLAGDGSESFPVQIAPTPGSPNAGPALPRVVVSKLGYREGPSHPPFIELYNRTDNDLPLNPPEDPEATWAIGHHPHLPLPLPTGLVIKARHCLVLVRENPDLFRLTNQVPEGVPIVVAPDILLGLRPENPILLFEPMGRAGDGIRRMIVEQIGWKPEAPWPPGANAIGHSLQRINPNRFAGESANWRSAPNLGTIGIANIGNRAPRVWAGGARLAFTGREIILNGVVVDDSWDGVAATANWSQLDGPATAMISQPSAVTTRIQFPVPGIYHFKLEATDGLLSGADTTEIEVRNGGFESWAQAHFPNNKSARSPNADPDEDGMQNLEEYVFGTSPSASGDLRPLELAVGQTTWTIAWSQRFPAEDFAVVVESSNHLDGPWIDDPEFYQISEAHEEASSRIVAREKYPVPGRSHAFVRLRLGLR